MSAFSTSLHFPISSFFFNSQNKRSVIPRKRLYCCSPALSDLRVTRLWGWSWSKRRQSGGISRPMARERLRTQQEMRTSLLPSSSQLANGSLPWHCAFLKPHKTKWGGCLSSGGALRHWKVKDSCTLTFQKVMAFSHFRQHHKGCFLKQAFPDHLPHPPAIRTRSGGPGAPPEPRACLATRFNLLRCYCFLSSLLSHWAATKGSRAWLRGI